MRLKGRYGYIDRSGEIVVEPAYSDAGYCFNGRMPVAVPVATTSEGTTNRWGLIGRSGEVVLPLEHDCIEWGSIGSNTTHFYGHHSWDWP